MACLILDGSVYRAHLSSSHNTRQRGSRLFLTIQPPVHLVVPLHPDRPVNLASGTRLLGSTYLLGIISTHLSPFRWFLRIELGTHNSNTYWMTERVCEKECSAWITLGVCTQVSIGMVPKRVSSPTYTCIYLPSSSSNHP